MFRKYFSIDGDWRNKEIEWWLRKYPEISDETYILQEKIHGCNISWVFEPNESFRIAKRSGFIKDGSFYNHEIMYKKYDDIITLFKEYVANTNCTLNVFGEWFGKGIQKGVDYGNEKQLLFFDVIKNDELLSPFEMEDLFSFLNIEDMLIPNFGKTDSLQEALDTPIENIITNVYPEGGSIIEGIVIKSYYNKFFEFNDIEGPSSKLGKTFYLKKKNEKFKEIQKSKKKKIRSSKQPKHIEKLRNDFEEYVSENRLNNIFSKEGMIQTDNDIGKYIKLFIDDAKKDFTKDNTLDIMDCSTKELKYVFNVSKIAVNMIKKRL